MSAAGVWACVRGSFGPTLEGFAQHSAHRCSRCLCPSSRERSTGAGQNAMVAARRGLFSLPEGHQGVCPLAAKIQEAPRTGDVHEDAKAKMRRDAYVRLVDGLWKQPEYINDMASYLDSLRDAAASKVKDGQFAKVSTLRCLDEPWCVGFLSGLTGWRTERFEQLKKYEADAVKHLMSFSLGASLSLRLSSSCRDKELLKLLFETRSRACGGRLEALAKLAGAAFDKTPDGDRIAWERCGVYKLVWNERHMVESITHTSTGDSVDLPSAVSVNKEFTLVDNYDDYAARLELGPVKFSIQTFFAAKALGPYKVGVWKGDSKHFKGAIEEAESELDGLRTTRLEKCHVEAPIGFMESENKRRKREEAASKAREALKRKQAEASSKRRVSLKVLSGETVTAS